MGDQLLGREENGLVHDGRVQAVDKDLLALGGGVPLDADGAADNALFRLMDVPADFADVDGIFEDGLNRGAAPTGRAARRGNAHAVETHGE